MILEDIKLDPEKTHSDFQGCEFDYSSNTYRLHVTVGCGSVTIGENFLIVKNDFVASSYIRSMKSTVFGHNYFLTDRPFP